MCVCELYKNTRNPIELYFTLLITKQSEQAFIYLFFLQSGCSVEETAHIWSKLVHATRQWSQLHQPVCINRTEKWKNEGAEVQSSIWCEMLGKELKKKKKAAHMCDEEKQWTQIPSEKKITSHKIQEMTILSFCIAQYYPYYSFIFLYGLIFFKCVYLFIYLQTECTCNTKWNNIPISLIYHLCYC